MSATAILLVHGSLRERMAAELTGFVYGSGGVIVGHDQYVDRERSRYFARLEWSLDGARIDRRALTDQVRDITRRLELTAGLYFSADVPRIALFVSNLSHCLYDILGRWRSGEWRVEIPIVVSNHESLGDVARRFDVEFRHVPVSADIKNTQEHAQIELLHERQVELVVLARYMQLVGPELIEAYPNRIINIHHAFLPAFPGARPYHRAHRRGVKIIGATSHYVTEELDAGPIIEQDVIRVSHATSVDDMLRLGRDLERTVLARAVWLHLQRRVLVDEGRTVIFA
ncbi:MAG: formyltetrahydrofolate deformylase [Chloroflexi bacterium]|nr:MAG: formyltetrahydrofolate deformylase [Chloroflexota bacterium]TMB72814.1 MAG: formyltetrahydrofolate deformylase [Chloroflexota bacterium]TMC28200.1 MAG: formyltetrahydrofolate deformylase [Chloroflexota bacterium]TMC33017.1 MAG: formyltetrahydrofolate deformylase [Chloroflexota bacterium]TMC58334.1 MAG: formyltetrahydrofolate deformylase [Chloroflexota bacterium]